ncbi:MAG: thioredoxin-disulfide reductase [Dehalococcoidia bacterium]|nr:thioredoxin-disulfide reductase [Dehalococcoidia bacterium]
MTRIDDEAQGRTAALADEGAREVVDVAIIGGGPAGLAAALYASRARRRTVLWEGGMLGGQVATTERIENYPGYPDSVHGVDLVLAMHRQAEQFGTETRYERVTRIEHRAPLFVLHTEQGHAVEAKSVVVTAGAEANKLGVPGEAELVGRGVSYCATCDAAFFTGQQVAVVGGGDAALDEALFTARFASKVTVIHRRDTLRASRILQERAFATPNIEFLWDSVVETVYGESGVEWLTVRDVRSGATRELPVAGLFIFIGQTPNTGLLEGLVPLDRGGHAEVNLWMETPVPGLFVAGDVRAEAARQLVSAAGDGATAAIRADHYLSANFD